jgi:hypothetical protein
MFNARRYRAFAAAVLLLPFAVARTAQADSVGDTIRTVLARHRGAAVTLAVVIKTSGTGFGSGDNTEVEVAGVVIDPSGLVVTTNIAIDPAATFAGVDREGAGQMTTRVISARILAPDGSGEDIPARVVLRDSDRNLAFLRPIVPPKTPLPFVDLKTAGKAQTGDQAILLSRFGPVGNRATQANVARVVSVLERPRTVYLLEGGGIQAVGNIAFNEQGQPLGLVTVRVGAGSRRRTFGGGGDNVLPVVVPADDVLEEAAQAPAASTIREADAPAPKKPAVTPGTQPNRK